MLKVFFLLFAILSLHCQYPSLAAEREDIILLMFLMYVHNQSKICNRYVFFFLCFLKEISSAHRGYIYLIKITVQNSNIVIFLK